MLKLKIEDIHEIPWPGKQATIFQSNSGLQETRFVVVVFHVIATAYGYGVYFARDASYSFRYVGGAILVGDYCQGRPNILQPDPKEKTRSQSYTIRQLTIYQFLQSLSFSTMLNVILSILYGFRKIWKTGDSRFVPDSYSLELVYNHLVLCNDD